MMYFRSYDEEGEHSDKKDCVINFHFFLLVWNHKRRKWKHCGISWQEKGSSDLLKSDF